MDVTSTRAFLPSTVGKAGTGRRSVFRREVPVPFPSRRFVVSPSPYNGALPDLAQRRRARSDEGQTAPWTRQREPAQTTRDDGVRVYDEPFGRAWIRPRAGRRGSGADVAGEPSDRR